MNALQILVVVVAACCASEGRNIRSRRFVNQPPPDLFSPGNNHVDIQALMALLRNPMMMEGFGQVNSQQQQRQQQQVSGQIPQTSQSAPNKGQPQPEPLPAQNAGQGQQGQTSKAQKHQAPAPAQSAGIPKTLDPMQQFMGYSNRFTDPMFLQYFQRFMRRMNRRMKPKYRKGDFIPRKGLFPGGYVISADGSDAEVRDIYGKLHSIDGGVFQS